MLSFSGGTKTSVSELVYSIESAIEEHSIEGITLLGGEPFAHSAASVLADEVRARGLSVMVFSGFTLSELKQKQAPDVDRLLAATDLLIDGPYLRDQPDSSRRWIGSSNQQIHFLTERYSADEAYWKQPDTLEIRLDDGEVSVNGFPAKQAVGLWKRPKSKPIEKN
jgi:anaerobic ribonucleoside-triphosphate reductase activating protein